jgi:hypothetical protein
MVYPHSSRVSPTPHRKPLHFRATLKPQSLDTTRMMETPEVVAISTPDLHPLELYSIHTSHSFLRVSGSLVESLSSRSFCSFVPAVPPFPHFFIFPWSIPVLLCKSWKPVILYLLLSIKMHFSRVFFSAISLSSLVVASPLGVTSLLSATTTTSSDAPCPTQPEAGTYCGFVNPEDPCAPQPGGLGPRVVPDTVSAFQQYQPFQSMSLNNTYVPDYTSIYTNLTAAANGLTDYLGMYYLPIYSPSSCAAKCNELSTCNSFNIYVERDPSVNPKKHDSTAPTVWGYWCPNPPSITNYVCALWGSGIYNSSATNHGQYRGGDFQVVIAGSNGFVKNGYYNSTSYWSGAPAYAGPTSGMPGMPTPSGIVAFTGGAGASGVQWMWGVAAFVVSVSMML